MLKEELGVDSKLEIGPSGTFAVSVHGRIVAERRTFQFPSEDEILSEVAHALGVTRPR